MWGCEIDRGRDDSHVKAPVEQQAKTAAPANPPEGLEKLEIHQKERGFRKRPDEPGGPVSHGSNFIL
jgi:hypothetical protein